MSDIEKKKRVAEKLRERANMPDSDLPCDILYFGDVVLDILQCGNSQYECFMALAELIEPDEPEESYINTSRGFMETILEGWEDMA